MVELIKPLPFFAIPAIILVVRLAFRKREM